MKKFPDDSLDSIEKIFAEKILKNFRYYKNFWEEFIGVRNLPCNKLAPYGLDIPTEDDDLIRNYEKICIAHYSLFCNLAGAHYQLEQAIEALKIVSEKRHFYFWEACDNFYQHLQNTLYMMYRLWEELCLLTSLSKGKKAYTPISEVMVIQQ